ncbi:MAG: hypothetical protein AAGA56_15310, partial [Myxococcota bacterium]
MVISRPLRAYLSHRRLRTDSAADRRRPFARSSPKRTAVSRSATAATISPYLRLDRCTAAPHRA